MNILKNTTLALIAFSLLGAACSEEPGTTQPPPGPVPYIEDKFDDQYNPQGQDPLGPATLIPGENPELAGLKDSRRLSVDQLRNSIPAMFDGITWAVRVQGNDVNAFDRLSRTLGEADYREVNQNNLEPSPLFAKYMDDMAGDVCSKAITRDQAEPPENRVLVRYDSDVDANLRWLRLKLHGIYVPDGSLDGLEGLKELYVALETDIDESAAWGGICVAMLTAPEFVAY